MITRNFSQKLLYLGLGEMGHHIAGFFSKQQFPCTVWNRTYSKTKRHMELFNTTGLSGDNPFVHDISDIDLIFSCLPTSVEIEHYADLMIKTNPKRKHDLVWVDNTSGVPSHSFKIAEKLEKINVGFIDAPVSGGRVGASTGKLAVMVGGKEKYYQKAEPVLKTIAKSLIHIGEKVGSGHAVKAYNNLLYGCNILLAMKIAQSLESNNIDLDRSLRTIINASGGSAAMARVHTYSTNNRSIDYKFKTSLLIKDMKIGISQLEGGDKDKLYPYFNSIMALYNEAAKTNWDEHDVFDIYSFIEQNPKV